MAGSPVTGRPARARTWWRWAGIVSALVLAAILWAERPWQPDRPNGSLDAASGDVLQRYPAAERQRPAPFTARLLDGGQFDSEDLRGRVAVLNVWGSWCGPCRLEAPDLVKVAGEFGTRVRFLGINVRDSPAAARAFERSFQVPYPSIHPDDSAEALLAFGGALVAAAVPSTVVLDAEGLIAARVVGRVDDDTLRGLVRDLLRESRARPG